MHCLKDFILSKGCSSEGKEPKSGLWLENLEGISIKNAALIADNHTTGASLLQEKIDFAGKLVLEDVRALLMQEFHTSETKEAAIVGVLEPEKGFYESEDEFKGVYIEKRYSTLGQIIVDSLTLLCDTTIENKSILISDGITQKELKVNLTAGVPTEVYVGFSGITDWVTIKWNTSDIRPAASSIRKSITNGFCGYCGSGDAPIYIQGLNGNQRGYSSYGIQAHIQLKCDLKKAFCHLLDDLKFAILYKAGIQILKEWQSSTRLNFITIHSEEWLQMKLPEWEELTYPKYLNSGVQNILTYLDRMDSRCFQKNGWKYDEATG